MPGVSPSATGGQAQAVSELFLSNSIERIRNQAAIIMRELQASYDKYQ